MGYALRPRKKWTKDNSSLGGGAVLPSDAKPSGRTVANGSILLRDDAPALASVVPWRRSLWATCTRGDPAVDIDIVRRLVPIRSRYFFIRSLTGSLTFSILSISTLRSPP